MGLVRVGKAPQRALQVRKIRPSATTAMRPTILLAPLLLAASLGAQSGTRFPYSMDFGPCMTATVGSRGVAGTTLKGLAVRLGERDTVLFDTELLRLSAAWTDGWLRLRGTAYDGSHGPVPSLRGTPVAEVRPGPGWAHRGSLDDPRPIAHGPLPREWGRYRGHWLCGDRVVIGYAVDDMAVLESHDVERDGDRVFVVRHLDLGPSAREQVMVVADAPEEVARGPEAVAAPAGAAAGTVAALQWVPAVGSPVEIDVSTAGWGRLSMGGPSSDDHLDAAAGTGATLRFVPGFARPRGRPVRAQGQPAEDPPAEGSAAEGSAPQGAAEDLTLPRLHDGLAARDEEDRERSVWFDRERDGDAEGRLHVDLGETVDVTRISTFSWHRGGRAAQDYEVFGSDAAEPPTSAPDPAASGWRRIARVRTGSLGDGDCHGASVHRPEGLGRCRHLLFAVRSEGTWFSEIDVYAGERRAAVDAAPRAPVQVAAGLSAAPAGVRLEVEQQRLLLRVPPHDVPLRCRLVVAAGPSGTVGRLADGVAVAGEVCDLQAIVDEAAAAPAPRRWAEPVVTAGHRGPDDDAFAVDTIAIPFDNPWGSRMRTCGFDFFADGRAAITTWNGDVWIVSGIDEDLDRVEWSRFAAGLFDPLGLAIVGGRIHVHGRDGITRLGDRDGNGEADHFECFNHDVLITPAFHEFAFDLQVGPDGSFYCSKGGPVRPGGRGFSEIVPHHGTILRISSDGERLDVVATGLRAPNGIGVSPEGIVTSGDNEGTWMPRCRLNWITSDGYYGGVRDTAHRDPVPETPDLPLCWMPMEVDNSSGGQVWVTSDRWSPLEGRLLHLSYGTCSVYLVLAEEVAGRVQGGVVRLPVSLASSAMRGRFHPLDGQLYVAGFQGWQTSAAREGGFQRIRRTGQPLRLPVGLRTCKRGVYLTFACALDPETANDPTSYGVEVWDYVYSQNYGSPEVAPSDPSRKVEQGKPNRDALAVHSANLSRDGCTVFLEVPSIQPVMQMKITYNLDARDGALVKGEVHNTIHALAIDPGMPGER